MIANDAKQAGAAEAPQVTVFAANGVSFVAGLQWVTLKQQIKYKAEARAYGKKENLEMVTIRQIQQGTRLRRQAGFAPRTKSKGRMRSMYSLAATLCGTLGSNFVAVFEVEPGLYALVAAKDGAVIAGRDRVGDKEEIRKHLTRVHGDLSKEAGKSELVTIAPAEFEFYEDNRSLAEILPKKIKGEYKLTPLRMGLSNREWLALVGAGGVLAVGGFMAVDWWEKRQVAELEQLELARQATTLAAAQAAAANVVKPWEMMPAASDLLRACAGMLDKVPLSVAGWVLESVTCTPEQVGPGLARYVRGDNGAPMDQFEAEAKTVVGAHAMFPAAEKAELPFVVATKQAGPSSLNGLGTTRSFLTAYLQGFDAKVVKYTIEEPQAPALPPGADPESAPAPQWSSSSFEVKTDYPGDLLLGDFNQPGFVISKVETKLAANTAELSWVITGEIYAR